MKKSLAFIVPILICFLSGLIAGEIQAESIRDWYPTLVKPVLTPPNAVFPIAWTIIYLCIGISLGLVINAHHPRSRFLIRLFVLQLFFNFLWSVLFFYFRNPLLGFADILILDMLVIYYIFACYPVHKTASVLFMPYLLWLLFATYLNGYILFCN